MNEPDIRLLSREDTSEAIFPGGRNEAFRVYFAPEVHAALWTHAGEDTSVEICGVLVGTWHRDDVGPFVTVVESIRGEGATTKFAEVTFTHQTWAKINAAMGTTFAHLKIVGWYHTHPDFGIFLSDRDRFIQEHFFSGPGQVAHVIDPVRRDEGVFIWKEGKPAPADHFWVGDRILTGSAGELAAAGSKPATAAGTPSLVAARDADSLFPPPGRPMMYASYGAVFLVGYLLATVYSLWDRQRFVEAELAHNSVPSLLRLGLADELDALQHDLQAVRPPLDAAQARSDKAEVAFADVRQQLAAASRRIGILKERFGNTPGVDEYLYRLLVEKNARSLYPDPERGTSKSSETKDAGTAPPAGGEPSKK